MALTLKARLGPYEILSPLGAGGMGEVYRARDTRLDREVAIKVLPQHLSRSPEFKQRFEREARAISKLSHPNICTLYDIGQHDGVDYLVMEYLEGEPLAERLSKGALPIDQVLRYGVEIASALDQAHRHSVVHRDLKPGNIMLTKSGAKLLDFGLAKSITLSGSEPNAVTMTGPLTGAGTILGTFQYMAPEQLEGKEADPRTDIFAFGAVLHETATGKRAFEGSSRASLIASIMSSQPRPISELQPLTPKALDRLVRKCLAKDPDARWQSVSDVADELRWIAETGTVASRASVAARPGRLMWLAWALVTLLVAGLAVRLAPRSAQKPVEVRTIRLSLLPTGPLDLDPDPANVAISPDGTQIVFVASESQGAKRLWLRPLTSQTAQPLQGTEGGETPFWSPDSRFIAFFACGKLKKVATTAGAPQVLCDAPDGRGGAWNRDDVILFAPASGGILQRVDARGGVPTPVTQLDAARGENAHRFPCFLPDGKHFLYVTLPSQGREYPVRLGSLEGGQPVDLLRAWGAPVYTPPGLLVFPRGSAVMVQRFDAERLALIGEPVPIPEVSNVVSNFSGADTVSVSSNGVLVSAPGWTSPTKVEWFDREGRQEAQIPLPEARYQSPVISPDGGSVAIFRGSVEADDLLRIDLARSVATQLTFGNYYNNNPRWSPDGRWIVFTSNRGPSGDLYRIAGTGGDQEELVVKLEGNFNWLWDCSRDGRFLIYSSLNPQTNCDLWLVPMTEEPKPVPFLKTPFDENDASLSPDGRWIAYHSNESGRKELYVQSFSTPGSKTQISTEGANEGYLSYRGNSSVWWRRADEILYLSEDRSTMMAVAVEPGESVKVGASRALFKLPTGTTEITASPDGQRFLVIMGVAGRAQSAPTVVVNWDAGLLKP